MRVVMAVPVVVVVLDLALWARRLAARSRSCLLQSRRGSGPAAAQPQVLDVPDRLLE